MNRPLVALFVLAASAGCMSSDRVGSEHVHISHALLVQPGQHIDALEAAVVTLRDGGYAVDRADFRLGVVTARPEPVATALEPWHASRQLDGDAWAATAGHLQRIVRIDFAEPPSEASDKLTAAVPMRIQVQLERFEVPTRRVINAAKGRVFSALAEVPAPWSQRGIDPRYWRPMGRDAAEEQRLQKALSQALAVTRP